MGLLNWNGKHIDNVYKKREKRGVVLENVRQSESTIRLGLAWLVSTNRKTFIIMLFSYFCANADGQIYLFSQGIYSLDHLDFLYGIRKDYARHLTDGRSKKGFLKTNLKSVGNLEIRFSSLLAFLFVFPNPKSVRGPLFNFPLLLCYR